MGLYVTWNDGHAHRLWVGKEDLAVGESDGHAHHPPPLPYWN